MLLDIGGGTINMKLNGVVLMLFTLVLSTSMTFASAADQTN